MKHQRGFINIKGWQIAFVVFVIEVLGYAAIRTLGWV
jgi:hypothetical protein